MTEAGGRWSAYFWPSLLVLLISALFIPNLVMRLPALDIPESRDLAYQWHPYYIFLRDSYLASHAFPLWNPYDLCGTPFLAFSHSGALYFLNVVYLLFDFATAMSVAGGLHLIIAGLGGYYLFRAIGASEPAAFICGMSYALAGFVFNNFNFPPSLYSASWLPWIFRSAFKLTRGAKIFDFLGVAACTALCLFGGDIEVAGFGLLAAFGFMLLMPAEGRPKGKRFLAAILAVSVGGLMYQAQFLPSFELMQNSIRAGGEIKLAISAGHLMLSVLGVVGSLLYPFPFGAVKASTLKGMNWFYLGLAPLLGFLSGLYREKNLRRLLWIFGAALVFALFVSNPVLHKFIAIVPVLGQSLVPLRLVPALELVFLVIAAKGIDYYLSGQLKRLSLPTVIFPVLLVLMTGAVSILERNQFPGGGLELRLISAGLLLSMLFMRGFVREKWVIAALVAVDLYGWSALHFPRTDYERFNFNPEFETLASNTDPSDRYYLSDEFVNDPELPYSAGMILKAGAIDSWTRTPIKKYAEVLGLLFPDLLRKENEKVRYYDQLASRNILSAPHERTYLLNLLNVRRIFSRFKLTELGPEIELAGRKQDSLYIYDNKRALPRAFRAGEVRVLGSDSQVLSQLAQGGFDYGQVILASNLEMLMQRQERPEENISGEVVLARPDNDKLLAIISGGGVGWLFLSEAYYPGWKARIDGKEARIFSADYAFRAVFIPAGTHKLRLDYEPVSFRIGLYASFAAIIFIFIMCITGAAGKRGCKPKVE